MFLNENVLKVNTLLEEMFFNKDVLSVIYYENISKWRCSQSKFIRGDVSEQECSWYDLLSECSQIRIVRK